MAEVTMPRLSDTMQEGTIAEWLKKEGDQVAKGDVLVDIETDKATMSQESYENGVLEKILVKAGETVAIGTVIAIIGDGSGQSGGQVQEQSQNQPAPATGQASSAAVEPAGAVSAAQAAPPASNQPAASAPSQPPAQVSAQDQASSGASSGASSRGNGRVKASPLARRMAAEFGLALENIRGSGPGGRILSDDVTQARQSQGAQAAPAAAQVETPVAPAPAWGGAAVPSVTPAPSQPTPAAQPQAASAGLVPAGEFEERALSRMRQTIARRMTESKQQVPHFYITSEVNMTEAMKWRQTINTALEGDGGAKVSVNDMLVKAVAKALQKYPDLNSSFDNTKLRLNKAINIGIAVALPEGLIVPVVHNVDQKALGQIARETRALGEAARGNKLKPEDLQGGTFTISNLGMYDVDQFVAIINQPQAAILAVGSVKPTVVVKGTGADGQPQFEVIQAMKVTISVDHRATDGAVAAQFLQELKRVLQNPMLLLV